MERSTVGYKAENIVRHYLTEKGYEILAHNWRKKWGELDIVTQRDGIIVFVEVKAGMSVHQGFDPLLHANREKMRKVARTARTYLASCKYPAGQEWQIDVVALTFDKEQKSAHIQHFKNIELT